MGAAQQQPLLFRVPAPPKFLSVATCKLGSPSQLTRLRGVAGRLSAKKIHLAMKITNGHSPLLPHD